MQHAVFGLAVSSETRWDYLSRQVSIGRRVDRLVVYGVVGGNRLHRDLRSGGVANTAMRIVPPTTARQYDRYPATARGGKSSAEFNSMDSVDRGDPIMPASQTVGHISK